MFHRSKPLKRLVNHWVRLVGIALLSLFATVNQSASATQAPRAYFSFENGVDGVGEGGGVIPVRQSGFPTIEKGRFGNAIRVGPLFGRLEVANVGDLIRSTEGTVEMWVMPVDWQAGDGKFHVFFEARNSGAFYLYKYVDRPALMMLATDSADDGPYFFSASRIAWVPGQWHHIAGTWSQEGVQLYVDGQPTTKGPVKAVLPQGRFSSFRLGDSPWHSVRTSSTLLDEVRVYDRALGPREILNAYNSTAARKPETAAWDDATTSFSVDRSRRAIQALLRFDPYREVKELSVRFSVWQGGRQVSKPTGFIAFENGEARGSVNLSGLKPGAASVHADGFLNGRQVFTNSKSFDLPALDWDETSVGSRIASGAASPEVDGTTVSVWGRRYDFRRSALPVSIRSGSAELLAGPISVYATSGVQTLNLTLAEQEVIKDPEQGAISVISRLVAPAQSGKPEIEIDTRAQIAADGLVLVRLSTTSQTTAVGELGIRIPISAEHAVYRHIWTKSAIAESGLLPGGIGEIDRRRFSPFYWIGDTEVGLFWFSESARMWPNALATDAIRVIRRNDRVILEVKVKTARQQLPSSWSLEFGLQATPVKSLPIGWRDWRLAPSAQANIEIVWPQPDAQGVRYYGYPEASSEVAFAERMTALRMHGREPAPYVCPTYISTASPEWRFYRDEWMMGGGDVESADVLAFGYPFAQVIPTSSSWTNFITSKTVQFAKRFALEALYFDNLQLSGGYAPLANLGITIGGQRQFDYPILGYRKLLQSIREGLHKNSVGQILIGHVSGKIAIPMLSSLDAYVDGEQYRGVVQDDYLEVLPLETFRAEFIGRQWGLVPIFLPEFSEQVAKAVEPTRGLMALLMLHDVLVWPKWSNVTEVDRALNLLRKLRHPEAEFLPYFGREPPAHTGMADVYISGYRSAGNVLLIVGNLAREWRSGEICVEKTLLGKAGGVVEWPEGRNLAVDPDGCLNVSMMGRDYRFLAINAVRGAQAQ